MIRAITPTRILRPLPRWAASDVRRLRLFRHELRALLVLAGPIVVSQLGNTGMNITDTLMVGPLGAHALASAALAGALHFVGLVVCTGVILGMAPLVSQAFGAGERDRCRAILVQGLWVALALSVPFMWVSLHGESIARALGQEPVVAEVGGGYLAALAWGIPPALVFVAFRQYFEGMGIVRPTMIITFFGLALNVLGNWAFIYGLDGWIPAMGVVGSGWSTSLVRWGMLGGMLLYALRHPRINPLLGERWRPDPGMLRRIAAIGTPIGGQLGAEVGLFALAAVMMGWFGAVEMAAHQVTINIASGTFMVALGVSLAGSVRVGQHVGARNPRAMRRAVAGTYLLTLGFMAVCAVTFLVAPAQLIGLYTSDPEIIRIGASLLLMAALFQLFDGGQVAGLLSLRGAADTRIPTLITVVGYWVVGVPAAYMLGFRTALGPVGIWLGLAIALAVVALLLARRVRRVLWEGAPAPAEPEPVITRAPQLEPAA